MLCISVDVSKDYEQVENVLKQVRQLFYLCVCVYVCVDIYINVISV